MKKLALVGLMLVVFLGTVSPVLAQKPVLKVAADCAFVPFEFVDENNKIVGFDVDLAMAIGEAIGYEVQFLNLAWEGLIPSLLNKNIDMIASGMSITEERAKQVNFSDPYFTSVLTIVVHKNNNDIKTLDDLAGKKVGVQINTTGDFAASEIDGAKVSRYNTVPETLQNIVLGIIDAAVIDMPVADAFFAANPNAPLKHVGKVSEDDYFGLAIRKEDTELLAKVNAALKQLKEDGTYDKIYNKWFSGM
ncbi:MAG: basic amino acid ABC transporter substrate-binding protein [Limnochordia bacterium]|jgi:polar amino acid transport system substrate-binding protein|nr:basic amino acid ABC transporter substrate-binding protein [Bacillota bacterium]HOB09323.1 basic amino acid ABC transporter substrate-binding protein [Limnochordia bacterium]NLH30598.1 basic amino acid ABC transporter substrate-binding protein [Bacillota bacterium]HPT93401.1 basic amino acid ABC transporter substrate-binding protein [Limnochordia bacterium]HPZ30137.1 basic amino acid ABC transporter substrate-binding protein [Limnochordia bacterium]